MPRKYFPRYLFLCFLSRHDIGVIMNAMASQITDVSTVCSTACLGADQTKHQSFVSLAFVRGIHRWPPSQRASNAEKVSIWELHHVKIRPVMRSFSVFDVSSNKLFSKQSNRRWSEKPWWSCDVTVMDGEICTLFPLYRSLLETEIYADHSMDTQLQSCLFLLDIIRFREGTGYRWISHECQWRGALKFPFTCAWINGSAHNSDAGDWGIICWWIIK